MSNSKYVLLCFSEIFLVQCHWFCPVPGFVRKEVSNYLDDHVKCTFRCVQLRRQLFVMMAGLLFYIFFYEGALFQFEIVFFWDCIILRNLEQGLKVIQQLDKIYGDNQPTPILIQRRYIYNAVLFTFWCLRYSKI